MILWFSFMCQCAAVIRSAPFLDFVKIYKYMSRAKQPSPTSPARRSAGRSSWGAIYIILSAPERRDSNPQSRGVKIPCLSTWLRPGVPVSPGCLLQSPATQFAPVHICYPFLLFQEALDRLLETFYLVFCQVMAVSINHAVWSISVSIDDFPCCRLTAVVRFHTELFMQCSLQPSPHQNARSCDHGSPSPPGYGLALHLIVPRDVPSPRSGSCRSTNPYPPRLTTSGKQNTSFPSE